MDGKAHQFPLENFRALMILTLIFAAKNIPIIRRPTGGKGILHFNDLTYSFSSKKEGILKEACLKVMKL